MATVVQVAEQDDDSYSAELGERMLTSFKPHEAHKILTCNFLQLFKQK